jgi:hypothetical protein
VRKPREVVLKMYSIFPGAKSRPSGLRFLVDGQFLKDECASSDPYRWAVYFLKHAQACKLREAVLKVYSIFSGVRSKPAGLRL